MRKIDENIRLETVENMVFGDSFFYTKIPGQMYKLSKLESGIYVVTHYVYISGTPYNREEPFTTPLAAFEYWDNAVNSYPKELYRRIDNENWEKI